MKWLPAYRQARPSRSAFAWPMGSDCFKITATVDGEKCFGLRSRLRAHRFGCVRAGTLLGRIRRYAPRLEPRRRRNEKKPSLEPAILRSTAPINCWTQTSPRKLWSKCKSRFTSIHAIPAFWFWPASPLIDRTNSAMHSIIGSRRSKSCPTKDCQRFTPRVQHESESDRSGDKLYGIHVALRYEGQALPADTARAILATLDSDFASVAAQLGCRSDERIVAIVQSREAYMRTTGAAEWSGGQYDGRIHIAWTDGSSVGPQMQRALAHELVHACLTSLPSGSRPWPALAAGGAGAKALGRYPPGQRPGPTPPTGRSARHSRAWKTCNKTGRA